MKNRERAKKMIVGVLFCLALFCMTCCASAEEAAKLPLDFSGGMPLKSEYFFGMWTYLDPTISVNVRQGRTTEDCDYWVATIEIKDASQLRTAATDNFNAPMVMDGSALAKRVNAVLAIDGDFWCYTEKGYIMRQGELFVNVLNGNRDVLLIDEDGDFHIVPYAKRGEIKGIIDGKKIINAFYFGPALILNGEINWYMDERDDMAATERRQRMCIAQVGPLTYKCICCGPPARGSTGMTLLEFAHLVKEEGVQTAYNLDGGNSCMMFFNGEKINDMESEYSREISDIIYFASAYGANK